MENYEKIYDLPENVAESLSEGRDAFISNFRPIVSRNIRGWKVSTLTKVELVVLRKFGRRRGEGVVRVRKVEWRRGEGEMWVRKVEWRW